jgi:F-type H+-transporting ATPase subunit gamma
VIVGRRLAATISKDAHVIAALDGPSVGEEVQPIIQRLMNAVSDWQASAGRAAVIELTVLAHGEQDDAVSMRPILPGPKSGEALRRHPYPPLLNLAPATFFKQLVHHYAWAQMHDVFYSSLMAENRRRLQHLEGAMRRMEEKCNALRRKCNLLRQEEITEEIEIIMLSNEALHAARWGVPDVAGRT